MRHVGLEPGFPMTSNHIKPTIGPSAPTTGCNIGAAPRDVLGHHEMGILRDQVALQDIRDGNGAVGHQGVAIQPEKPVDRMFGKDLQSHLQMGATAMGALLGGYGQSMSIPRNLQVEIIYG